MGNPLFQVYFDFFLQKSPPVLNNANMKDTDDDCADEKILKSKLKVFEAKIFKTNEKYALALKELHQKCECLYDTILETQGMLEITDGSPFKSVHNDEDFRFAEKNRQKLNDHNLEDQSTMKSLYILVKEKCV
jgi:hypothetical protein